MSSSCAWFPSQKFEPRRYSPGKIGNWSGHLPFAHDLVVALRPSIFVELGTHLGESYFGFCQALAENEVACLAYAVDTWTGEVHTGFYDESVYEEVAAYNETNYWQFSYLLRSLFDDALPGFADESIELLHIDGLHTFEAVSHDFLGWLPKVKPGGIVLLHDVAIRDRGFGVWRLWDDLKSQGETFEFHHSWGLGVFRKPGGGELQSELLKAMFAAPDKVKEQIRRYYSLSAIELAWRHIANVTTREKCRFQVYFPSSEGYSETNSYNVNFNPDRWECLRIELLQGITTGQLRLDPGDSPAVIEVRGITLSSAVDRKVLWSMTDLTEGGLTAGGTLIAIGLPAAENGTRQFFSYGIDPQLYLPMLDAKQFDQPLTLEVWVRLRADLNPLLPLFDREKELSNGSKTEAVAALQAEHVQAAEKLRLQYADAITNLDLQHAQVIKTLELRYAEATDRLNREHAEALAAVRLQCEGEKRTLAHELAEVTARLAAAGTEHEKLIQEVNRRQTKIYLLEDLHHALPEAEKRIGDLEDEHKKQERAYAELQAGHRLLIEQHKELRTALDNILRSHSWRVTKPLRRVVETLQGR